MKALYQWLFPEWAFKNANKGSALEQAAAQRYNVQNRNILYAYIQRWMVIGVVSSGLGAVCDVEFKWTILAATFLFLTSYCIVFMAYLSGALAMLNAQRK